MSIRHTGFVCIGRKDGEYYFVDSVFDHGDNFQGATGCIVRPVSVEEYEEASEHENVAERLYDDWLERFGHTGDRDCRECEGHPHSNVGCDSCGILSLDEWTHQAICTDGVDHLMFDGSYACETSPAFDAMGIEHATVDCSGCGRIFGRNGYVEGKPFVNFDEVYNRKALVAIQALEDGAVSADYAARIIFDE